MTVYDQIIAYCVSVAPRSIFSSAEIQAALRERHGTNPASVLPADYCYNRWNRGITNWRPLFLPLGAAEYQYLGPGFAHTGMVFARAKGSSSEEIVGEWVDGVVRIYPQPVPAAEPEEREVEAAGAGPAAVPANVTPVPAPVSARELDAGLPLSAEQIERLFGEYMALLELEVRVFGCKPTETRHLIGRLGEFFCVRRINGRLAAHVNQAGFDVIGPTGRRVSVKTTAQREGFVSISAKTLDRVDDLMVIQYAEGAFEVVYHGDVQLAVQESRPFGDRFELDLRKARRLAQRTAGGSGEASA